MEQDQSYSNYINIQNVKINFLNTDTKQVIQKDFIFKLYPTDGMLFPHGVVRTVRNGSDEIQVGLDSGPVLLFMFPDGELENMGYDSASFDGYVHTTLDEFTGAGTIPHVVNFYLKPLAK